MKGKGHSIKYNFIMNIILTASNFLFPIITFPYITRILEVANYGKVNFVASIANYFLMIASLGIPTYGIRACAQVKDDEYQLSKVVRELLIINSAITLLTLCVYIFCVLTIPRFRQEQLLFVVYGVSVALNFIGVNWLYQGLEKYDYITIRNVIVKILSIVLIFLVVRTKDDYIWYSVVMVFSIVGANIFNIIKASKIVDLKISKGKYKYSFREHLKPILILFAQSLAISIYTNLDSVMLGIMKTDIDVGLYNAAIKFKGLLVSVVAAFGNVALPRMSYFVKKNMESQFLHLMKIALNFSIMISFPLTVFFLCFSKDFLLIFTGNGYLQAVFAMQLTTLAVFPNGMTGILGTQVLTAVGKEKFVLYSVLIGAIMDFILNLIFIPRFSYNGAAFATMIAEYAVFFCQLYYAKEYLLRVRKEVHVFRYLFSVAIAFISCFALNKIFYLSNMLLLVVSGLSFFVIYFACLFILKDPLVFDVVNRLLEKVKGH